MKNRPKQITTEFKLSESMSINIDHDKNQVEVYHDRPTGNVPVRYIGMMMDKVEIEKLILALQSII